MARRRGVSMLVACVAVTVVTLTGCSSGGPAARGSASPSITPSASPSITRSASPSVTPSVGATRLPFPAPSGAPLDPTVAAAVQAGLEAVVQENRRSPNSLVGVPGLSAAIVSDAGTWSGAAGVDGQGQPVAPEAMFGIGSITKTFIAAEVLKLAHAGKVDLDAPLSRYLRHRLARNGATVRQTLGMVSGLRDKDVAVQTIIGDPGRRWTPEQAIDVIAGEPLKPGRDPDYANVNYMLLGLLVRNVTHRPVETVLRHDVLGPAHLARVAVQPAEKPSPPTATGASDLSLGPSGGYLPTVAAASFGNTAGGMAADAPSIARWGYLLYGGRFLPPSVARSMTDGARSFGPGSLRYGLGTMTWRTANGVEVVGHDGNTPGYSSMLAVVPARHLSLAVLAVHEDRDMELIVGQLLDAALR